MCLCLPITAGPCSTKLEVGLKDKYTTKIQCLAQQNARSLSLELDQHPLFGFWGK